jgi:elongation factor 1-alpha
LTKATDKMPWFKGCEVTNRAQKQVTVTTIADCLENYVVVPTRPTDKPLRVPINGIFNIKGTGDILTGRCEQGTYKAGLEVVFIPTHTDSNSCTGKVFSIEMHHKKS